ncbi:MAG TPA: ZIP family metal transporter [Patescibacteria group bacterium]|nr:ZIP family metal transporter [Patescibacteria group bacterium]
MIVWYALLSVVFVSLLSLLGAVLISIQRKTLEQIITYTLAFSSGVLLGSTFFELLPEGVELFPEGVFVWTLVGFVSFFCLEKIIQWHHHVEGRHLHEEKPLAYLTLIGDGIHNLADGAVIAASYLVSIPLGITTTIAIIAHEVPHELSDFLILIHGGLSNKRALLFNFLSATTAVIGTVLVLVLSAQFADIERFLVPFAAGNFLYIAASDLIPELLTKRHGKTSVIQVATLLFGISITPFVSRLFGAA